MVQVPCALSADVDGARCFENTGLYHVPKLHGELDAAGYPPRVRRGRGRRTLASSRSVKRCSSSTFSCVQARCRSSACAARAEAGGSHDSFITLFDLCEDHDTLLHRVTSVMPHNLGSTPHAYSTACNSQFAHSRATVLHGRGSLNSVNSVRDTEAGGQRFCVLGETKAPSTSTRPGVRRSTVDESAHPQQTPFEVACRDVGRPPAQPGPEDFPGGGKSCQGCDVALTCPSCPDYYPEPLGQGRIIREHARLDTVGGNR